MDNWANINWERGEEIGKGGKMKLDWFNQMLLIGIFCMAFIILWVVVDSLILLPNPAGVIHRALGKVL